MQYIGFSLFIFFILDITSIIATGMAIGGLNAITLVFISIIIGIVLFKFSFAKFNQSNSIQIFMTKGQGSTQSLALLLSALLFIMPGFISDFVALIILIKPVQKLFIMIFTPIIMLLLKKKFKDNFAFFEQSINSEFGFSKDMFENGGFSNENTSRAKPDGNVYDATFHVEDDENTDDLNKITHEDKKK